MNTIRLAGHEECTGCGACAFKCPKQCILMQEDRIGVVYPVIDTTTCIECHSCEKVCPVLNEVDSREAVAAYAAWSSDEEERRTSASGGIAMELYKYAVEQGWAAVGASQNDDFSVTHKVAVEKRDLAQFKNSKYVFSDAYEAFPQIKTLLKNGRKVLFIGLPCQVAALRKLFSDNKNLLLVDLVCHGTTPYSYLKQHVEQLSRRAGKTAKRMSFRDPCANTYTFTFTLYDENGERFYAKRTKDGDTYQLGYHRGITYRENCYHCLFAKPGRNADITIADYHGLGKCAPCAFDARNVSVILTNTEKGSSFVKQLMMSKRIYAEQRPLEEPFKGEAQLRHPSVKNKYRLIFEEDICKRKGLFENAIRRTQQIYNIDMVIQGMTSLSMRIVGKMQKMMKRGKQ